MGILKLFLECFMMLFIFLMVGSVIFWLCMLAIFKILEKLER